MVCKLQSVIFIRTEMRELMPDCKFRAKLILLKLAALGFLRVHYIECSQVSSSWKLVWFNKPHASQSELLVFLCECTMKGSTIIYPRWKQNINADCSRLSDWFVGWFYGTSNLVGFFNDDVSLFSLYCKYGSSN